MNQACWTETFFRNTSGLKRFRGPRESDAYTQQSKCEANKTPHSSSYVSSHACYVPTTAEPKISHRHDLLASASAILYAVAILVHIHCFRWPKTNNHCVVPDMIVAEIGLRLSAINIFCDGPYTIRYLRWSWCDIQAVAAPAVVRWSPRERQSRRGSQLEAFKIGWGLGLAAWFGASITCCMMIALGCVPPEETGAARGRTATLPPLL